MAYIALENESVGACGSADRATEWHVLLSFGLHGQLNSRLRLSFYPYFNNQ